MRVCVAPPILAADVALWLLHCFGATITGDRHRFKGKDPTLDPSSLRNSVDGGAVSSGSRAPGQVAPLGLQWYRLRGFSIWIVFLDNIEMAGINHTFCP